VLARGITNKLIHSPTAGLKEASASGRQELLSTARKLLGLASDLAREEATAAEPESAAASSAADIELGNVGSDSSEQTLQ
jgi:glutamyl-tRNA reductase